MNEMTSEIEVYDSDRLALNKVLQALRRYVGTHRDLEGFRREAMQRFEEAGYIVEVTVYEDTTVPHEPVYIPSMTLLGRIEGADLEFDHDKMGHEVRSNILGVKGQDNVQAPQVAGNWDSTNSGIIVPKT